MCAIRTTMAGIRKGAGIYKPTFKGFSLLEVLVASTVFSIGLAGLAALLLANIGGSALARHEGTATTAAASLAEQIRLNPLALNRFLNPPEYVSRICMDAEPCSPEQQADYDFRLWQLELADNIRNARGLVCHDTTPQDGENESSACDGDGALVIKIFWSGRSSADVTKSESGRHRVVMEVT